MCINFWIGKLYAQWEFLVYKLLPVSIGDIIYRNANLELTSFPRYEAPNVKPMFGTLLARMGINVDLLKNVQMLPDFESGILIFSVSLANVTNEKLEFFLPAASARNLNEIYALLANQEIQSNFSLRWHTTDSHNLVIYKIIKDDVLIAEFSKSKFFINGGRLSLFSTEITCPSLAQLLSALEAPIPSFPFFLHENEKRCMITGWDDLRQSSRTAFA